MDKILILNDLFKYFTLWWIKGLKVASLIAIDPSKYLVAIITYRCWSKRELKILGKSSLWILHIRLLLNLIISLLSSSARIEPEFLDPLLLLADFSLVLQHLLKAANKFMCYLPSWYTPSICHSPLSVRNKTNTCKSSLMHILYCLLLYKSL